MQRLKKFRTLEDKINIGAKILCGLLIVGIVLIGKSYAEYKQETDILFINARVGKFVANDIQLAMLLDGEEIESPPSKDNYIVTVDCDNATGRWDTNEWGAIITNITSGKVKCEVNFASPLPTLSDIIATSTQTSINLSYTVESIGESTTTCKYGTSERNYENSVKEVQNTGCSITGLEAGVIYYYQVCTTNSAGETCKKGSIKTKTLGEVVKVGDYIYMAPTSTSYTIATSVTGYTSDQIINPSELNLWRVIKVNSDGTVEMVSDKVSSKEVYFQGKEGYINLVGGLNTIAAQYSDGAHVKSTRHIGYSNQTKKLTDTSKLVAKSPWTNSTCWDWTCTSSGFTEDEEKQGAGDIGYTTDYQLVNGVYGSMVANNPSGSKQRYWLASRRYSYKSDRDWYFLGRYVNTTGGIANEFLYYYNANVGGYSNIYPRFAVRPIVTIKADTRIVSGDGQTEGTAYSLG